MMSHGNELEKQQIAQLVLDNVLDGIITIDKRGIIESYNPAAKRIFGYDEEEVLGKNINVLMPEPYHSEHDSYMHNYLTTGQRKIIGIGREVVGLRKDRSKFPMTLAVTEFKLNGESHFVGIVSDITDRKETEAALRKALRDDFSHTVKNLQNLVFKYKKEKNGNFIYTLSEGHLAQKLDISHDRLLNKTPREIFPDRLADELEGYYEQAYQGEHVSFEMNYGGKVLYIILSPISEVGGEVREVVGSGVDITDQKKIETALSLARDQALEASELKSQFLANMSHEIRTPMNGIIGVTELLYDTTINAEQRDFINIIRDSAQSLLTIINDILDFSKMEAGKMKIDQIDFTMPSLVEGISEILVSKAYSKELALLTFIDPLIPIRLHGDPIRLRQILLNLTDNAIKFTSDGSVVIRAVLGEKKENLVNVQFAVIDTGIGISEEQQKRLFQPFVQADGSTTRKYGGTGLGLAISKRLVELMGGKMGVESEPDEGTTFWFDIPFEIAEAETQKNQLDVGFQLESLRVLIVNDDRAVSDILKQYLDSWGMLNNHAKNGIEALSMLKEQADNGRPYDIALVNLEKTGMDSMTFATVVQQDQDLAMTKLIYITGFEEKKQAQQALRSGFTACLKQPVKQSYLLDCFASLVNQSSSSSEVEGDVMTFEDNESTELANQMSGTILLAEDNPVNRKVAQYQLKKLGYSVETVTNGLEAVQQLDQKNYSLILMDIQMPEMDGVEATQAIRKRHDEKKDITIVAMTANAMQSDKERYLASGIDDYLSKPVKLEQLKAILEKWLQPDDEGLISSVENQQQGQQSPPISMEKLLAIYGPDMEAVKEFLNIFLESTPPLLNQLIEAVNNKDSNQTSELSHGLKGASAVIEAQTFSSLCKQLEQFSKEENWESIDKEINILKEEFEKIKSFIEKLDQNE